MSLPFFSWIRDCCLQWNKSEMKIKKIKKTYNSRLVIQYDIV